jgi:hypothetical protein
LQDQSQGQKLSSANALAVVEADPEEIPPFFAVFELHVVQGLPLVLDRHSNHTHCGDTVCQRPSQAASM